MPSFQMGSLASGDSSEAWLRRVGLSPAHFGPRLVSAFDHHPLLLPLSAFAGKTSCQLKSCFLFCQRYGGLPGEMAQTSLRVRSDSLQTFTASVYPCVKWNEQSRRPSGVLEEAAGFCMWSWGVGAALTVLWPGRLGRPTSASPVLRPEVPDQAAGGSSVGGGAPGSQTRLLAVCPRGREMRGSF